MRELTEEVDLARVVWKSDRSGLDEEQIDESEVEILEATIRLGTWPPQKTQPVHSPSRP
jgi:hypothetical protein